MLNRFAILNLALLLGSAAQSPANTPVILLGGGVIRDIPPINANKGMPFEVILEGSVYFLDSPPKALNYLQSGWYAGLEMGDLTVRPYMGLSSLLVGIGRLPILNLGVSSCIMLDVSEKKAYYTDVGAEASVWLGTLLGTFKLSGRSMFQDPWQTRLAYLFKIPIFTEKVSSDR